MGAAAYIKSQPQLTVFYGLKKQGGSNARAGKIRRQKNRSISMLAMAAAFFTQAMASIRW